MTKLSFQGVARILCIGAHSDDIEIGAGGTLLELKRRDPTLQVRWVVFSGEPPRDQEAKRSARDFLAGTRKSQVQVHRFRTSFFPYQGARIKSEFEKIKKSFTPDLVLTHFRDDRHQDHRVLSDLTWNSFRNHLILEYEIPKYDGDLGVPNLFFPISHEVAAEKVRLLMRHFRTQQNKHWFDENLFLSLMRIRGMECAAPLAEAFHARKITL